jgi:hypothetical protein
VLQHVGKQRLVNRWHLRTAQRGNQQESARAPTCACTVCVLSEKQGRLGALLAPEQPVCCIVVPLQPSISVPDKFHTIAGGEDTRTASARNTTPRLKMSARWSVSTARTSTSGAAKRGVNAATVQRCCSSLHTAPR